MVDLGYLFIYRIRNGPEYVKELLAVYIGHEDLWFQNAITFFERQTVLTTGGDRSFKAALVLGTIYLYHLN